MSRFMYTVLQGALYTFYFILQCYKVHGCVVLFTPTRTIDTGYTRFAASPLPRATTNGLPNPTIISHIRRQAPSPGKIIIISSYESLLNTEYPPNICGLVGGDPKSIYSCDPGQSCAVAGSALCCADDSSCTLGISKCYSYSGGDYYNNGNTNGGEITCGYYQACYTVEYPGGYYHCGCASSAFYLSLVPGSNVLSYFSDRTLVYSADYANTLQFQGTLRTSSTNNSTSTITSTSTFTLPTNALGFLNRIATGAPLCANNITDVCPTLYSAARTCWNTTAPISCFCPSLKTATCPGLCNTGEGPADYVNWVLKACSTNDTSNSTFSQQWIDFQPIEQDAYAALFPWNWQIKYIPNSTAGANATSYACPSTTVKLSSFATVNGIVLAFAILLGRRSWVEWYTCGHCGKLNHHDTFVYTAFLSIALNLCANLINAVIIRQQPGFHHVNVGSLILLWASRPRLAWLVGVLVNVESRDQMYWNLGASALLSEVVLQGVGSVYIGTTGNWARRYHYYLAHHLSNVPHGRDALLMYGGALVWLVAIGGAVIAAVLTYTPAGNLLWKGLKSAGRFLLRVLKFMWRWIKRSLITMGKSIRWCWRWLWIVTLTIAFKIWLRVPFLRERYLAPAVPNPPIWEKYQDDAGRTPPASSSPSQGDLFIRFFRRLIFIVLLLVVPFIGQWLFWSGFLRMAENLYCPPRIWSMTGVWAFFSILGVFFGAAL